MTVASSKPMTQGALYASLSRSLSLSASELCHHHKPSQSAGGQGTDVGKRWFPANQLTAHCSHGRAQLSSVMPNLGQQNCLADPQTCGQKSMSITVRHCNGQLLCSITVAINNGHRQGSQNYTSLRKPMSYTAREELLTDTDSILLPRCIKLFICDMGTKTASSWEGLYRVSSPALTVHIQAPPYIHCYLMFQEVASLVKSTVKFFKLKKKSISFA